MLPLRRANSNFGSHSDVVQSEVWEAAISRPMKKICFLHIKKQSNKFNQNVFKVLLTTI